MQEPQALPTIGKTQQKGNQATQPGADYQGTENVIRK